MHVFPNPVTINVFTGACNESVNMMRKQLYHGGINLFVQDI